MGARSGFDADGNLGEIRNVVDNGSGAIAVTQRVANVLVNLGLTAGTASGGSGSGQGANGTPVTPGTAQASTVVVLDASKNFTGINNLTVANLTASAGVTVSASGIAVTGTSSIAGATTISVGTLTLTTGTATVAPLTFAAGTNLTTAAAGAVEFDGTAFYASAIASTRQVVLTEQFVRLTGDYTGFTSTSSTAQQAFNNTTNGALTLEAATTYGFEAEIYITNSGTSSHTWAFGWGLGGSASVTQYSALYEAVTATSNALTALSSIWATSVTPVVVTAASTSSTENVFIKARGYLSTNVAGTSNTFTPQLKLSATTGTGSSVAVKAGSFLRIWPLGVNTVASVGNWS